MTYFLFALGLALLVGGGELLVRSGMALAHKLRLNPLIIGIVLMGVGTSLPELSASLTAMVANPPTPGIAFGNVIGSNITNILFILGVASCINPIGINRTGFRRDGMFILLSVIMLYMIMAFGYLDQVIGMFLLLFIAGYFVVCYGNNSPPENSQHHIKFTKSAWVLGILSAIGIGAIVYGADLLVDNASKIATALGISKSVMGLTLIAFGTSLPEITVATVAAIHKQSAIAFGNIVGSNIANIFLILGTIGVVKPTHVPQMWQSFGVMTASTLLLLLCGIMGKIHRITGFVFLIAYGFYVYSMF